MAASASKQQRPTVAARLWADRHGNIATMAAVLVVPLVLLAGGATDYARSASAKTEVQQALDRAVMEAVKADPAQRQTVGVAAFRTMPLRLTIADDPVFTNNPDGSLSAVTRARVPTAFLSMAGIPKLIVRVEASAGVDAPQAGRCLTLVPPSATFTGIPVFNAARMSGANCVVDIQLTTTPQFTSSTVATAELCVRSGTVSNLGSTLTNLKTSCTSAGGNPALPMPAVPTAPTNTTCPGLAPPPVVGGSRAVANAVASYAGGSVTFTPGLYCGQYAFSGTTIVLNPGDYVFKSGPWDITGGSLTGSGVSLHFTDASPWTLNGLTALNLSAPTSGARQGVLFSDSLTMGGGSWSIITRPTNSTLSGLIYTGRRSFNIDGAGLNNDRLNIVVNNAAIKNVTGWTVTPLSTSASGSGTGGTPTYLTS